MVSVDGSLFIQVVNFVLLIWILNMVFYKPVREILAKRKGRVSGLKLEVNEGNKALSDNDNAYVAGIKQARIVGQRKKEKLIEVAVSEEAAIIEKINEDARLELEKVKDKIKTEINTVKRSLKDEVGVFAKAIGKKILGRIV